MSAMNRRQFLKASAVGLGGLALSAAARRLWAETAATSAASGGNKSQDDAAPAAKANVYELNEPKLLDANGNVQAEDFLWGVIKRVVKMMSGQRDMKEAWRTFFTAKDVIGIKFDPVAADDLRTSAPMARILLDHLLDAGFDSKQIMLIEGPQYTASYETRPMPFGYDEQAVEIDEKRQTHLCRALGEVTAILNVPSLKDHRLIGLSCGVANLALGLVNNPYEFTDPGGDPGVARLLGCEAIRSKHRLTLVNGIRGIFDGGPRADPGKTWNQCSILAGTDVVATDRVALDMLDAARFSRGLKNLQESGRAPKYLETAAAMGLGVADLSQIKIHRLSI